MFVALGCASPEPAAPPADTGGDVLDLRADWPDPPEGGTQIRTPAVRLPPGSDALKCLYGQWDGPDMGVVSHVPLHPLDFHHHSLLKDVPPTDTHVTGDWVDCGGPDESGGMPRAPLFHSVHIGDPPGTGSTIVLPEGMAFRFPAGQRWSADVHYINPTDQTVLVDNAFNLGLVPAGEVETWIGSFEHDVGDLSIPSGGQWETSFDCPVAPGASVLSISSHMHSYGMRYVVDVVRANGRMENLLLVEEWLPEHRYEPPQVHFSPGELVMEEGDTLRTTCVWFNGTDSAVGFPTEMCTTSGVATDLDAPVYCEAGELVDRTE
jgi:hypothetical protein